MDLVELIGTFHQARKYFLRPSRTEQKYFDRCKRKIRPYQIATIFNKRISREPILESSRNVHEATIKSNEAIGTETHFHRKYYEKINLETTTCLNKLFGREERIYLQVSKRLLTHNEKQRDIVVAKNHPKEHAAEEINGFAGSFSKECNAQTVSDQLSPSNYLLLSAKRKIEDSNTTHFEFSTVTTNHSNSLTMDKIAVTPLTTPYTSFGYQFGNDTQKSNSTPFNSIAAHNNYSFSGTTRWSSNLLLSGNTFDDFLNNLKKDVLSGLSPTTFLFSKDHRMTDHSLLFSSVDHFSPNSSCFNSTSYAKQQNRSIGILRKRKISQLEPEESPFYIFPKARKLEGRTLNSCYRTEISEMFCEYSEDDRTQSYQESFVFTSPRKKSIATFNKRRRYNITDDEYFSKS